MTVAAPTVAECETAYRCVEPWWVALPILVVVFFGPWLARALWRRIKGE